MSVFRSRGFALTGLWFLVTSGACLGQPAIQTLVTNGPSANRIHIVFLSEGYTTNQASRFIEDARNVLGKLFATSPYNEYQNLFNVSAIFVASNEPGADHPWEGKYRDTYFNSTYDSYGIDRLLTIPPNNIDSNYSHGEGKVSQLLQELAPDYDIATLIVNDDAYGGSGGTFPVTSINGSAPEIMIHELGHSFAHLGDEYGDAYPGFPDVEEPNTTRETNRDLIKWTAWIDDATPIPTPQDFENTYEFAVGLFEGAHYHFTGWYRPKLDCKMRTLGTGFCEVCSEALVLSDYRIIRPVESWSPASTNLTAFPGQMLGFRVTPVAPQRHSLQVQWSVDNAPVSGATNLDFTPPALLAGTIHTVQATVTDPTPLVRNDPRGLLAAKVIWQVTATEAAAAPRLESSRFLADGKFHFTVTGDTGSVFVLESSANLQTWLPILTNSLSSGGYNCDVTVAPDVSARYYRARLAP